MAKHDMSKFFNFSDQLFFSIVSCSTFYILKMRDKLVRLLFVVVSMRDKQYAQAENL